MIFFSLLLAHLLADFIFQPHALVAWKQKSWWGIFVHVAIHLGFYGLFLVIYLGDVRVWALTFGVALFHFWIDFAKIRLEAKSHLHVGLFFLDQALHIFVLALASWLLYHFGVPILPAWVSVATDRFHWLIFLILAIISTAGWEIATFQFRLEHDPKAKLHFDKRRMLIRFLIVASSYGTILLLFLPPF